MKTKLTYSLIVPTIILFSLLILFNCKKEPLKVTPTVTISSVTNITSVSASTGGNVTADGGATLTARGICWSSTNKIPTTADGNINSGSGLGSFTCPISGLSPGTTFYVNAYATNSVGTSYSSTSTFSTLAVTPNITTTELTNITTTTAVGGGTVTSDGGSPVLARGACWSTKQNPTLADNKTLDGTGIGIFTSTMTGLKAGTIYYVKAYATNSVGTMYGNEVSFKTAENIPPIADGSASDKIGQVGSIIKLTGSKSIDFDKGGLIFQWRQLHGGKDTRKYMTANDVNLPNNDVVNPSFTAQWPGNYVFELTVTDKNGLRDKDTIDVMVNLEGTRKLDVESVTFWDYYGNWDTNLDVTPSNSGEMIKVFDQALDAVVRMGGKWASIDNISAFYDIYPLPKIGFIGDPFSLNDNQLELLVNRAKLKGLKFCLQENNYPYDNLTPKSEIDSLYYPHTMQWWDQWFAEYQSYIIGQAKLAERLKIEMIQILLGADFTFNLNQFPQYDKRWRLIISEIRKVYSGKIGMSTYVNPLLWDNCRLTFLDALDVYMPNIATLGGGFPLTSLKDPLKPTLSELKTKFNEYFDKLEITVQNKVPIYVMITIPSWDGQNGFKFSEPAPRNETDFQEQVDYYEAFFQAIYNRPQIHGVFVERISWFEQLIFSPNYEFFYQGGSASVRNKPAEEVVKMWFKILN